MGTRTFTAAAAVAAVAVLAAGIGQAGAASKAPRIGCTLRLHEQGANPLIGEDFGTATCSGRLGAGVQHDSFRMKLAAPPPPFKGTGVVRFQDFFDTGTISGVWTLKWSGSSPADLKFTIVNVKIVKGTGAFKGIRGSGTGRGHLTDATHGVFTWTATVSGI